MYKYLRKIYRLIMPLIWAKKKYKFFMSSNMMDLELKTLRVVNSTNLLARVINPIPVAAPFGQRCLVIAPHQDDEAIGCGGAVLAHVARGGDVKIVLVQDGTGAEAALGMLREELMDLREKESARCAELMNVDKPQFLRYPKLTPDAVERLAADLNDIIKDYKPDTIFAPSVLDNDNDHMYTALALAAALKDISDPIEVYSYEVWGLCIPNVAVFIDEFMDKKCELINCFKSQVAHNDYAHAFKGLAMYHSLQFGAVDHKYVERYFVLPKDEFVSFAEKIGKV